MKTTFSFLSLLLFAFSVCAQITLDATYNNAGTIFPACFSTGEKYVVVNHVTNPDTIAIYNINHTLIETIHIPSQPANGWSVKYIADGLFDTDTTTVEYALAGTPGLFNPISYFRIYRDDGTLIFSKDSVYGLNYIQNQGEGIGNFIIHNDSGYFFSVHENIPNALHVYKLPGKMHQCGSCCDQAVFLGGPSPQHGDMMFLSDPVPNPANKSTTISYQLPSGYSYAELVFYNLEGIEIRSYRVGSAFHDIKISASDLVPGTYLYNLQTPDGKSDGKKMIVIR